MDPCARLLVYPLTLNIPRPKLKAANPGFGAFEAASTTIVIIILIVVIIVV